MGNQHNQATGQVGAVQLPSRESVTEHQIVMLQSVIHHLGPYLLGPHPAFRDFENPPKIDGGVASSASVTFVNVCSRIDALLADESRWDTAAHDKLYATIAEVQQAQITFLAEQAESARSIRRPSFQLRPMLANDGQSYIAFFGDTAKAGHYIAGMGPTPNAALLDFDRAFDRAPAEQVALIARDQGIPLETPAPAEPQTPKPKKKK